MDLISLVVTLIVVGVLLGLLNRYGAEWIAAPMLKLINAVVVIAIVLWLIAVLFGGVPSIPLRIPR